MKTLRTASGLLTLLACSLVAACPASAQLPPDRWEIGNYQVSGTPAATSGSAAGASGGSYYAFAHALSQIGPAGNGVPTSGGGTFTVSRTWTKVGSPTDRTIVLGLSVNGSANATGYSYPGSNSSAYADARSQARGNITQFPNAQQLDEEAHAAYPAGPGHDDYGLNNSTAPVGTRSMQISASTTFTGTIYVYTGGNSQNGGSGDAGAESSLTFTEQ